MIDGFAAALTAAAALAGIIGVILLVGRVLRHTPIGRRGNSAHLLALKETLALDARRRLHLVQYGERQVLLLTGGETDIVAGWVSNAPNEDRPGP